MPRRLINQTRREVVADDVEVADTVLRRLLGLLGRRGLPPGRALLLDPCGSIHTLFMRFAIDVVFLDDGDRVVRIVRDMRPWRIAAAPGAAKAVELAAGSLGPTHQDGDQLVFEPLTDAPTAEAGN